MVVDAARKEQKLCVVLDWIRSEIVSWISSKKDFNDACWSTTLGNGKSLVCFVDPLVPCSVC